MKKKFIPFTMLGIALLGLSVFTITDQKKENSKKIKTTESISSLRAQHKGFLDNSTVIETQKLNKQERHDQGLPPDKYFDQLHELTMNPTTGKTERHKIEKLHNQLQKQAKKKNVRKAPGDSRNNAWVERGPNNVGGRTRALFFDPTDSRKKRVFAGGVSGGLWKNNDITNANSTWTRVTSTPGNLNVTTITSDPRNSSIWYLGTGEQYTSGDAVGNGVYKSTDSGATWTKVTIPAAEAGTTTTDKNLFMSGVHYVNDIIAWDNKSQNRTDLFVAVGAAKRRRSINTFRTEFSGAKSAGLYRSIDNGRTWQRLESGDLKINSPKNDHRFFIPNDLEIAKGLNNTSDKLWMGTIALSVGNDTNSGHVFSSTDGQTWTKVKTLPNSDRVELEISKQNPNKIYALTEGTENTSPVHIYRTTNAFSTVTALQTLPNDKDTGIAANDFTRGQAFYNLMLAIDPTNDALVYVGGIDLFRSANSGASWNQISKWHKSEIRFGDLNVSVVHADQHAMVFRPDNNNQAIFGNDGGIYYANSLSTTIENGRGKIEARNKGYNTTQFVKAAIGPHGPDSDNEIFTAGAQDNGTQIFRSTTAGINSSEEISGGDGFFNFIDKDGEFIITSFTHNNITKFDLPWDGKSAADSGGIQLLSSVQGEFVNPMAYDSDANTLVTASFKNVIVVDVANNKNSTFTITNNTSNISAVVASPFEEDVWYVGNKLGELYKLTGMKLNNSKINNGKSKKINIPNILGSISSIRFGETKNDIMITLYNYGVTSIWYSNNAGTTWGSKEGTLPDMPVYDILQNPLDKSEVIVATELGVWATKNFNSNSPDWSRSQNGMSDVQVTSFDYWAVDKNNTTNKIIASTYGRGVYTGSFTANNKPDNQNPTAPTNLSASKITGSTITLTWEASRDNVGVSGYDIFQNNRLIKENVATTNFKVTGLTKLTSFNFTIKARDAKGNISRQSNRLSVKTIDHTYCKPEKIESFISQNPMKISRVRINNTSHRSQENTYEHFTNINPTNISNRNATTIKINKENSDTVDLSVYIDYNQDGTFNLTDEKVVAIDDSAFNQDLIEANFTVPNTALLGKTRMRIVMMPSNGDESKLPCGKALNLEAEEYTVNITNQTVPANTDPENSMEYCFPEPISNEDGFRPRPNSIEHIRRVQLGDMDNESGAESNGYTNYGAFFQETIPTLIMGENATITLTPGFNDETYDETFFVFIDYNGDNDFDDAGEFVLRVTSNREIERSFLIPTNGNINTGITRIRIIMTGVALEEDNNFLACDDIELGEVEDYNVIIAANDNSKSSLANPVNGLSFSLFPNPVDEKGIINIEMETSKSSSTLQYRIFNILGTAIKQGRLSSSQIHLQELKSGVYFMELKDGKDTFTKKFIKK